MTRRFLPVLAAALLLASAPAHAQTDATSVLQSLGSLSGTGGTSLDQAKSAAAIAIGMKMVDTDRNGSVSLPELTSLNTKMFNAADANHDGQLSQQELSDFANKMAQVMSVLHR